MYPNLRAEIARRGLTQRELAPMLGIRAEALSLKINGKSAFSLKEAAEIKKVLAVDVPIEILFKPTEGQ